MKVHAPRKARFRHSEGNGDVSVEELVVRPMLTELTVERIPALVREVDTLMQTLVAAPFTTGGSEALDASEELKQRADAVDTFCRGLRPGPLQEIVDRQVARLREAAQQLRSPSSRLTAELVNMGVERPRTRPVPIRVTPFMGSALARAAAKVGVNAKKHPGANSMRKTAAKPLYRWEKRRFLRGSTVAQPSVGASKASSGRKPKVAEEYLDEVDEAATELHPCSEPGHYSRSSFSKASSAAASTLPSFEFQIILTEEELKALKFQRRRLEAEQRHLSRRQKPGLASTIQPPPAPTAAASERRTLSQ